MGDARLTLQISGLPGEPPRDALTLVFRAASFTVQARFPETGETDYTVEAIPCRGGTGQRFEVSIESRRYRPFRFFQQLRGDAPNTPAVDPIRLVADAGKVRSIEAPAFLDLPEIPARTLANADMRAPKPEDQPLLGLQGAALYGALPPMLKACLLNLSAKSAHPSSASCAAFFQSLHVARQDRCYFAVDPAIEAFLQQNGARFKKVPEGLHQPLDGYTLGKSYKTKDRHANLQVTLMRNPATGAMAADVDIDEASGIEHGFEVIRNTLTNGRTNPYTVRELLLLAGGAERAIDPGYRFVF